MRNDTQDVKALLVQKGQLFNEAEAILTRAASESREMSAEEDSRFEAIHADMERITKRVDQIRRQDAARTAMTAGEGRQTEPGQIERRDGAPAAGGRRLYAAEEYSEGIRAWALGSIGERRTPEARQIADRAGLSIDSNTIGMRLSPYPLRGLDKESIREWERRAAMGSGSGSIGGYTVPNEMIRAIEIAQLRFGGIRKVATVLRTATGGTLPIPTSDDTSNKGAIVGENSAASEVDITFGQVNLGAYKYSSKYVLISIELLQDSGIDVAAFIGSRLGQRIGRIQSDHFTTGTGSSQPNGVITAATSGKTGATGQTTSVIYDDFVDLFHSVDPDYRDAESCGWMFNDSVLKAVRKIRIAQYSGDTGGIPLWQPGLALGVPDMILGKPYTINQSMASMAANAKSIAFGDLSKYMIRDVMDITVIRAAERFVENGQVGFLAWARADGNLIDAGTHPVKYYANSAT